MGPVLLLAAATIIPWWPAEQAHAAAALTIGTVDENEEVGGGIVRIGGTYSGAYDVQLVVNGERVEDARMDDPEGDDSGSWYYDLDMSAYDGNVELIAKGTDVTTRYNAWSDPVNVVADNPAAHRPEVAIESPADGATAQGQTDVRISVQAKNPLRKVEVRIDGGPWKPAKQEGVSYVYRWMADPEGDRTHSIEARAEDRLGNVGRSLTTYVKTGEGTREETQLPKQDRSMWIWENASYNLILNAGSREVLHAMAADTSTFGQDAVTTLYLGVDRYYGMDMLEDERKKVRDFVRWAHGQGYRVQALIAGGTKPPFFGAYERYREQAVREFEKVLNYNISSEPDERFDGVNVDTEPYSLPDFHTGYPSVQLQYLDMFEELMERKAASGLGLAVGPAIPRWYDSSASAKDITWNGSTKWLSQHIQDIADYIAIMDYRDQAEGSVGIIAQAQGEIDYANAIGKPNSVVIGVETKDIADGGDPETISFHEEGRLYMERELDKVYAAFGTNPAFAGIALHHYDTLLKFPSVRGPDRIDWQPPADDKAPSKPDGTPTARAFDHQRIDLSYGRASDNQEVWEYRIYRSDRADFEPDASLLAGTSRGLGFKDGGLLPDTTYYYRITAVDLSGNESKPTKAVSAATGSTTLKPMIVDGLEMKYDGAKATVTLQVADQQTGAPVKAAVHGRFTGMAGRYVSAATDAEGRWTAGSEAIVSPSGEAGFAPRRIMAAGYYWAHAYDRAGGESITWDNTP